MNKVFQVLWNKARGLHVVTSEDKRAFGKGKSKNTLLMAAMLASLGLAGVSAEASEITTPSGWSHTTIERQGNLHKITTDKILDKTGVNRFEKFTIDGGHIANLYLPGQTQNLLNFVNQQITVNGTVNSIKNSQIGGNLFFVTPTGMTVGATGVINAGSLTAIVSAQKQYENWTSNVDGYVNDDLLLKLQTADVSLAPEGLITVSGKIHASDRITLHCCPK